MSSVSPGTSISRLAGAVAPRVTSNTNPSIKTLSIYITRHRRKTPPIRHKHFQAGDVCTAELQLMLIFISWSSPAFPVIGFSLKYNNGKNIVKSSRSWSHQTCGICFCFHRHISLSKKAVQVKIKT